MDQVSLFGRAFLFLIGGAVFVLGGYAVSWLLRPSRPGAEKLTPYECGEEPLGNAWVQFNMRFYSMGLIFLVFDVEILLLFPWATIFADENLIRQAPAWGVVAAAEAFLFVGILLAGLAYIWVKKDIDWVKPKAETSIIETGTPGAEYAAFNERMNAKN